MYKEAGVQAGRPLSWVTSVGWASRRHSQQLLPPRLRWPQKVGVKLAPINTSGVLLTRRAQGRRHVHSLRRFGTQMVWLLLHTEACHLHHQHPWSKFKSPAETMNVSSYQLSSSLACHSTGAPRGYPRHLFTCSLLLKMSSETTSTPPIAFLSKKREEGIKNKWLVLNQNK